MCARASPANHRAQFRRHSDRLIEWLLYSNGGAVAAKPVRQVLARQSRAQSDNFAASAPSVGDINRPLPLPLPLPLLSPNSSKIQNNQSN